MTAASVSSWENQKTAIRDLTEEDSQKEENVVEDEEGGLGLWEGREVVSVEESLDETEGGFSFKKHSRLEDQHQHEEPNVQDLNFEGSPSGTSEDLVAEEGQIAQEEDLNSEVRESYVKNTLTMSATLSKTE